MHAIEVARTGGPEVLQYVDKPLPTAGDGQVLIKAEAIGVNYIDTYFRQGHYQAELPFVLGSEVAGTVAETGDGVTDIDAMVQTLSDFITAVEKTLSGKRMVIYTNEGFWNSALQGSDAFSGHPLWVANYTTAAQPAIPNGWDDWVLWQYSNAGSVDGIDGDVDLDVLNDSVTLSSLIL